MRNSSVCGDEATRCSFRNQRNPITRRAAPTKEVTIL